MNTALQQVIVWALVAVAALYSLWRLIGPSLRLRIAVALQRRLPADSGLANSLARYVARQRQPGAGCSSCAAQKTHD